MAQDNAAVDRIFKRVHEHTARTIRELAEPLLRGLEELGLGRGGNGHAFRPKLETALQSLLFRSMEEPPYAAMTIQGASEKRRAAMFEFFTGLGVPEDTAGRYADSLTSARQHYGDDGQREPITAANVDTNRHWQGLIIPWIPLIFNRGRRVCEQLREIKEDASKPYEGVPSDPDDGVEQTVDLLRRFPAIADYVYRQTSLPGLKSFPPPIPSSAGTDSHIFATAVQEHLDGEWWSNMLFAAGLAVVAIVVTVASFGTLGPVAAAALGMGLGTAQGGLLVFDRAQAVSEGRIAVQMGAMDEATLQRLENSLEGAWAMLAVDVATGGILGRFGGTTALSTVVRGTVISGAGGGIGTALDPNVWNDPDRVGLILQGVLINGAAGTLGAGAGAGLSHLARPGSAIQVALARENGVLAPGSKVSVGFSRETTPVSGTVVSVSGQNVRVTVQNQEITVQINRSVALRSDAANTNARPLPAMPDSAPRQMGYVVDADTGQVRATVRSRTSNDDLLRAPAHSQPDNALSGYPGLESAVRNLDAAPGGGTAHRLVEVDGNTAVQVLRPARGEVHSGDVVRHNGQDYYVSHVMRPEQGGSGVEVMPVTTRRNVSGVQSTQHTPMTPSTADTQQLMRTVRPSSSAAAPLLRRNIVHQREMGRLSGFAEHVVRERVVPNNLVAGATPAYQRSVLDQYNDGATFIFVSDWQSKRFFSWPSGTGTVRLDGSSHLRSTVGSARAHMSTAQDLGQFGGVGRVAPATSSATPGSGQAAYNEFIGGTFQFHGGKLYWSDKSNSINEFVSQHGRSDGRIFDDMHPEMNRRLQEWFGLRPDQIQYVASSRDFPYDSRPGH